MKKFSNKVLGSATMLLSMGLLNATPASAQLGGVTNVTVNNPNNPDILIYQTPDGNGNPNRLQAIPTPSDPPLNTTTLLDVTRGFCNPTGDGTFIQINECDVQSSPGSNVEIGRSTDSLNFSDFLALTTDDRTILTFTSDNFPDIRLKSLIGLDWFGDRNNPNAALDTSFDPNYNSANPTNSTFANQWFQEFLDEYLITDTLLGTIGTSKQEIFEAFRDNDGFQKFSDPNISFVNIVDAPDGLSNVEFIPFQANVGVSGFLDATDQFIDFFNLDLSQEQAVKNFLLTQGNALGFGGPRFLQAIELTRIEYVDATNTLLESYNYAFTAADSTLEDVSGGGFQASFDGIYDPALFAPAVPTIPETTPEPSGMVALLGLGGLLMAKNKNKQKQS